MQQDFSSVLGYIEGHRLARVSRKPVITLMTQRNPPQSKAKLLVADTAEVRSAQEATSVVSEKHQPASAATRVGHLIPWL